MFASDRPARTVALVTGAIFVVAGLAKFVLHGWELHAFRRFGLPAPELLVLLVGAAETAGGVLLLLRVRVAPVAAVLAMIMAVATVDSGLAHGDVIPSLTLAPALLVAMAFLLVRCRREAGNVGEGPGGQGRRRRGGPRW